MHKCFKKKLAITMLASILLQALSPITLLAEQIRICCTEPIKPCKPKHKNKKYYDADYIIIGMGGAGAVIANRLTKDRKTSVIGLEAGDNNSQDPVIIIPEQGYFFLFPFFYPQYFWQGEGVPQFQLDGQSYAWSSGRLLGGGTSINGLQVVLGSDAYWSEIEALLGSDWSLEKTRKRYKKLETYIAPFPTSPARGTNGPWTNIALPFNPTEDDQYLFNAMTVVSGMPPVLDFNNPETPNGAFLQWDTQERIENGSFLREATSYAFLDETVMTPNGVGVNGRKLRVHLRSTAIDLIWKNNKVIGVRYTQDGKCHTLFARKEVIVCAGFQSAQFLQRNGIGPKDILNAAGVPVRVDNPHVGELVNHTYIGSLIQIPPGTEIIPPAEPWAVWGPGAMLPAVTPPADPNNTLRDIQWISTPLSDELLFFGAGLMRVKSVGSVAIQNDDPLKIPLADANLLSNPEDIDKLADAYQNFALDLENYFEANPSPKGTWTFIAPTKDVMMDRDALIAFIKANASQAHHYCSTTKAALSPENGVVDPYGHVFGVKGLRVADVSILPVIPDGNTATPAVLIGWTIADFIRAGK
ncbi:MAG: GMC family oxidoreductase [Candidatus Babeliales bacterium]